MSRTKKEGLGLQKIYIKIIQKLTSIKGPPVAVAKGFATGGHVFYTICRISFGAMFRCE